MHPSTYRLCSYFLFNFQIKDLQSLAKKLNVNLENNNITTVDFSLVNVITSNVKDAFSANDQSYSVIYLANNPLNCNCYNYDLVRYFQNDLKPQVKVMFEIRTENLTCANPPELKEAVVETLPQELLICDFDEINEENVCPKDCSCSWRPYDDSIIVDCSRRNFTELPEIDLKQISVKFNQTEMHLEGNYLKYGPDYNTTGYDNVTKLYMSYNRIEEIFWLPPKLEVSYVLVLLKKIDNFFTGATSRS